MRRLIFLIIVMLGAVGAYSQVKRTGRVIDFLGKKYYMHRVEKGQTMHSISKAYGVSVNNLIKTNHKRTSDLREGEVLKIPYAQQVAVVQSVKYKHYIVKKGDTLYSLAKKFKTSEDELIKLNAGVEVALVKGRRLIVPIVLAGQPRYDSQYYYHIVKSGETLSSIGRRYGMRVRELKKINPKLSPKKMRDGSEVRIPVETARAEVAQIRIINRKTKGQKEVFIEKSASEKPRGALTQVPDTWVPTPYEPSSKEWLEGEPEGGFVDGDYSPLFKDSYKAALLLPLKSSHSRMVNYYKGMLLAIDENRDVALDLKVYDTDRSAMKVRRVLSREQGLDFILGPYTAEAFDGALPYAKGQTVLVSLLSKNDDVYQNPNVVQFNTTEKTINHKIAKYVVERHASDNLILFDGRTFRKYNIASGTESQKAYSLEDKIIATQNRLQSIAKEANEDFKAVLQKGRKNIVIVPVSDYKTIGQVLNVLNGFSRNNIEVIGYYKWKLLPNVSPELLFDLNTTYFTPYHYLASEQATFVDAYKARFNAYPDDFSFIGYQTMLKFLEGLKNDGLYFYKKLHKHKGGGYESLNLRRVKYSKNYNISVE